MRASSQSWPHFPSTQTGVPPLESLVRSKMLRFNYSGGNMNISSRARFAAATAAVLTAVLAAGVFAASTAQATAATRRMPNVTTYEYVRNSGYVPIQTWNCTPATHGGILNPETILAVGNSCSTRVYLHARTGSASYCVSPLTFNGSFDGEFNVGTLQVSTITAPC
jgi:hypothetical protein